MTTLNDLKPLVPEAWDPSIRDTLDQLSAPPNLHATLANHPALLKAWMGFRNHMVHGATVERRHLEIVILRTAHKAQAPYEWFHHARIALDHGITPRQVELIAQDIEVGDWDALDRLLLMAADECADGARISASTRDALMGYFDGPQILDLIFTIGMYTTLAFMLKTLEVPLDEMSANFSRENLVES